MRGLTLDPVAGVASATHESQALAVVDGALAATVNRNVYTPAETGMIFDSVCAEVRDDVVRASIRSMLNDVLLADGGDRVLERRRVADALLDVRMALASSG
ncbi:MAG: hypothetical protein ACXVJ7_16015 [Acidimicrobiia bacterium]